MALFIGTERHRRKSARHHPRQPDDLSGYVHRQLIGCLGLSLPAIVYLVAGIRNPEGPARWQPLDSISLYYYSGAVVPFVGVIVGLSLFLLTYQGFDNKYRRYDRITATIAGIAALFVAFYPTTPEPGIVSAPDWWKPWMGNVHIIAAVILLGMFALFSLWLFRVETDEVAGAGIGQNGTGDDAARWRRVRDAVYIVCGLTIIACLVWAYVSDIHGKPIFLQEALALMAFGISWLVKGRVNRSLAIAARSIRRKLDGADEEVPA